MTLQEAMNDEIKAATLKIAMKYGASISFSETETANFKNIKVNMLTSKNKLPKNWKVLYERKTFEQAGIEDGTIVCIDGIQYEAVAANELNIKLVEVANKKNVIYLELPDLLFLINRNGELK